MDRWDFKDYVPTKKKRKLIEKNFYHNLFNAPNADIEIKRFF